MVQTRFGSLYVCEIRFSKDPIGAAVITEMQATLAALGHPRGISYRPVLIHVNGVMTDVVDSGFFASIVDAQALLRPARKQPFFLTLEARRDAMGLNAGDPRLASIPESALTHASGLLRTH